jgi:acetyl esterase/lipase/V8-like Glu-specific endopeptidase
MRKLLLILSAVVAAQSASAIFYDADDFVEIDRIKPAEAPVNWRLAARSVAIMIDNPGPGTLDLSGTAPMATHDDKLESGYPYASQPRLAKQTAFLVARDKVMTAGHAGLKDLEKAAFIFDYWWDSGKKQLRKSTYKPAEIYRCKAVLMHQNDKHGDYALLQLNRPVMGRKPLTLLAVGGAAKLDMKVATMISAPDGTPLKLTAKGEIHGTPPTPKSQNLDLSRFFFHTLDNSGGSSGAPIFDAATGQVIGIHSGGDDNFTTKAGVVHAVRGNSSTSNLGRPLKGEWGSLIPLEAVRLTRMTHIPKTVLDGLSATPDVTHARYGDRKLEMDIYRPKNTDGALPAIVCIHGGGWAKGNRIHFRSPAQALAARGFVTASISYRLSGEAPFPAQIHDCKAAVRFLRANAAKYGINPQRIGVIGHSAGGHLAALVASSGDVAELEGNGGNADVSSAVQSAVPMGAQTDFLSQRTRDISKIEERGKIWRQFLGGAQEEQPATYKLASPLHHLGKNAPPCWFITGEGDDPSTHADDFRKRLNELGIDSGLTVVKGAPHGFLPNQYWFDQMIEAADAHFQKTLK